MSEIENEGEDLVAPEPEPQPEPYARDDHGRFAPKQDEDDRPDDPNLEAEARKYGWRPREEFTLKPEAWRPAKDFLDSPQTQVKILRDELKSERDKWGRVERTTQFAIQRVQEQERARYDAEVASIRAQKAQAVETADADAYRALEEREDDLRKQAPAPPQPERAGPPAEVAAYAATEAGAWLRDPQLATFGRDAIDAAMRADPLVGRLPPIKQVQLAERKLREYGLLAADVAPQQRHSRVDGGGLGAGRRARSIKDLPREAQDAFAMFTRQGVKITEADYIKQYEEG